MIFMVLILITYMLNPCNGDQNEHIIRKRSLLFPRTTVLQFTYGLSVPLILPRRTLTFSLCLQANYDLPYNTTLLHPQTIQVRSSPEGFDISREQFYKSVINFLDGFGINGGECLLKLICEIAEYPLHRDPQENLLENIVYHLFTPTVDPTFLYRNDSDRFFREQLVYAENVGKDDGNCIQEFKACELPLVDLFTEKYMF